jgi:hypothetical protein
VVEIDSNGSIEEVHQRVVQVVRERLSATDRLRLSAAENS